MPFSEKFKLSYNKEYGLFLLRQEGLAEGRRKKGTKEEAEGRRKALHGRTRIHGLIIERVSDVMTNDLPWQKEEGRRHREQGTGKQKKFYPHSDCPPISPTPISPSPYPPSSPLPLSLCLSTRFSGGQFLKESIPNFHAANHYSVG